MNDHHNYIKKKKKKKKKRRVRRENDLVYPHRKRCSRSRQVPIEFTIGWWGWLGVGVGREEFGFHWAMMLHSFAAVNAWKWYTMLRSIVSPAQTEAWKWKLFIQIEFKKKTLVTKQFHFQLPATSAPNLPDGNEFVNTGNHNSPPESNCQ